MNSILWFTERNLVKLFPYLSARNLYSAKVRSFSSVYLKCQAKNALKSQTKNDFIGQTKNNLEKTNIDQYSYTYSKNSILSPRERVVIQRCVKYSNLTSKFFTL